MASVIGGALRGPVETGALDRNRTCNCPLGGGRYIHLTTRARGRHSSRKCGRVQLACARWAGDGCTKRIAADLEQQVGAMASALGFQSFALGYVNPLLSDRSFWIDRMAKITWDSSAVAGRDPVSAAVLAAPPPQRPSWGVDAYHAATTRQQRAEARKLARFADLVVRYGGLALRHSDADWGRSDDDGA